MTMDMEPMEINDSAGGDEDAPEAAYEPINPSSRPPGSRVSNRRKYDKSGALKWMLSVLATAALMCAAKDAVGRGDGAAKEGFFVGVMESLRSGNGNSTSYSPTPAAKESSGEAPSPVPTPDAIKQRQIANYINGTAIIRNVHITHHAGTFVCGQMKRVPGKHAPGFACMGKGRNGDDRWPTEEAFAASPFDGTNGVSKRVWYDETEEWVTFWRRYFHFVSSEYASWDKSLHRTNWEYENLVSMIVMRHPLERFLAGGKCGEFHKKFASLGRGNHDPSDQTQDLYWGFANSECADNYALGVLARERCVQGANTSLSCLEGAKDLLKRFTFILDQSCLTESMIALGNALHLNFTESGLRDRSYHKHPPVRDRFKNDTLYEYVQTRFRRDIELYEWSKKRSIVVCDS